ncbi:hypothetical protein CY35_01G176400, partial [Sphagnum magellanicum]
RFLAMHYTLHVDLVFLSIEHIMRDVKGCWLLRYMHVNGASMFFIMVYLHIFRGLYYGNYVNPKELVWCLGVVILLLMIVTAFIGYALSWSQFGPSFYYWKEKNPTKCGKLFITKLKRRKDIGEIKANEFLGSYRDTIVTWLWGGFFVDNATLNPGVSILHLATLHQYGYNNPLGINSSMDKIAFYPYFYVKYLVAHIVPEWYFLLVYAILQSISNKSGGVVAIGLVFVSLFALPFINTSYVRWIGCQPMEAPYVTIGQIALISFFFYFAITFILGKL